MSVRRPWGLPSALLLGLLLLAVSCSNDSTQPPVTQDNWRWEVIAGGFAPSAVWGSGASDIFFVGQVGTIGHYDGVSLRAMASATDQALTAVWGSSGDDGASLRRLGEFRQ